MSWAQQERVSRRDREAAEMAEAAQAAAQTARFERLEQRVRRAIHGLFWIMAALWLIGLGIIVFWEWMHWQ